MAVEVLKEQERVQYVISVKQHRNLHFMNNLQSSVSFVSFIGAALV